MSTKKLRTIENLIILTFPVVLFAGCAGSDIKPAPEDQTQSLISQQQKLETIKLSLTESDDEPMIITHSETIDNDIKETIDEELSQLVSKQEIGTEEPAIPDKKVFYFDTNDHVLSDEQHDELQQHADYLIANPGAVLVINGHADVRGSENYNQSLSEKRAMETRRLLIKLGVTEAQLTTKGFGELIPMHAENNWDENRRIELEYSDPVLLTSM